MYYLSNLIKNSSKYDTKNWYYVMEVPADVEVFLHKSILSLFFIKANFYKELS